MKEYKLLIWGTGKIAEALLENGVRGQIIGFIETNKSREMYNNKKIYSLEEMPHDFDYILVANVYVNQIYKICMDRELDISKIIFIKGIKRQEGFSDTTVIKEILGKRNFTNYCGEFGLREKTFFQEDCEKYSQLNARENFKIEERYIWPIITEKYAKAGAMNNYFWQDLWAAKHVLGSDTKEHFDIGSRIDGFIAHLLAADVKVTQIDIRKFPGEVENLHTIVDDATDLNEVEDESIKSMSALCSLEHFGLGRYGDSIDPEACFRCFSSIQKKIKQGGKLYLALPIGKERVEFNAHRVFYPSTIIESFSQMKLMEFSCIAAGKIEYQIEVHKYDSDLHNGEYRYGLFYFEK